MEVQNNYFQANWPRRLDPEHFNSYEKVYDVASEIFSCITHPLHSLAACLAHPASKFDLESELIKQSLIRGRRELETLNGEKTSFYSPDGRLLGGMFFPGRQTDKVILFRTGNGCLYEQMAPEIAFLLKSGASVFTYNPGAVGESEGTSSSPYTLALDNFSAFDFLVAPKEENGKGIHPENIAFYGWSLGGVEIALGAALASEEYPESQLHIISDRSLASSRKMTGSFGKLIDDIFGELSYCSLLSGIWNHLKNLEPLYVLLCLLVLLIIKPVTSTVGFERLARFSAFLLVPLVNWDMDAKEALDNINGDLCIIYQPLDALIRPPAQIATAFKEEGQEEGITFIQLEPRTEPNVSFHMRPFYLEEKKQVLKVIQQFLKIDGSDLEQILEREEEEKKIQEASLLKRNELLHSAIDNNLIIHRLFYIYNIDADLIRDQKEILEKQKEIVKELEEWMPSFPETEPAADPSPNHSETEKPEDFVKKEEPSLLSERNKLAECRELTTRLFYACADPLRNLLYIDKNLAPEENKKVVEDQKKALKEMKKILTRLEELRQSFPGAEPAADPNCNPLTPGEPEDLARKQEESDSHIKTITGRSLPQIVERAPDLDSSRFQPLTMPS